jgi:hypothetical protein
MDDGPTLEYRKHASSRATVWAWTALALASLVTGATAQIYKCKQPDGGTSFQQVPCLGNSAEVPLSDAEATAHAPGPNVRAPDLPDQDVFFAVMQKKICDAVAPGFEERSRGAYASWRAARPEQVRQAEQSLMNNPNYAAAIAEESKKAAAAEPSTPYRKQIEEQCGEEFLEAFSKTSRPPDARFATPQRTWDLFSRALTAADRPLALSCLSPEFRRGMKEMFRQMSDDKMREMATAYKGVSDVVFERYSTEKETSRARGILAQPNGTHIPVDFERQYGEWKIRFM